MPYVICRLSDSKRILFFRSLHTWRARARGLLGTDEKSEPVALVRCSSIHTWGMRYAIDVAFVTRGGRVLKSRKGVVPRRMVSAFGSYYVFERPASSLPWLQEESWLALALVHTDDCSIRVLTNEKKVCYARD